MKITRRAFLRSALAAPFVAKASLLMPVQATPLAYMPGDLIGFDIGMWKATGWSARCEPVRRIEGQYLVFKKYHFDPRNEEVRIHQKHCTLFEGLPGNRVDNPSMAHRLIRRQGHIGLAYREDLDA